MSDCTIELARRADAPHVAEMSRRLIEAGLAPSWGRERVALHVAHEDSTVIVARADGTIAGFAIMRFGDDAAHLNLLAVERSHQRRGIGLRLLRWLEESALVAGTFLITLELRAGNAGAYAFYRSAGYRDTARLAGYYQGVEDAIRMSRDLRIGRGETPQAQA